MSQPKDDPEAPPCGGMRAEVLQFNGDLIEHRLHCPGCGTAPKLTEDERAVVELLRATYSGKHYRGRAEHLVLAILDRLVPPDR